MIKKDDLIHNVKQRKLHLPFDFITHKNIYRLHQSNEEMRSDTYIQHLYQNIFFLSGKSFCKL